jgi:DNA-binding NarL/FixJ family response regulator
MLMYAQNMMPLDVRVLIVAGDPLARAGIAALVADQPHLVVTGQTPGDLEMSAAVAAFAPHAVIWDLGWNPDAQMETLSRFCDDSDLPVLALLAEANAVGEVRAAGARGVLSRATDGAQIAAAAAALMQGLLVFDPQLLPAGEIGAPPASPPGAGEPGTRGQEEREQANLSQIEPLSARELDVLRGLAEGLSNKQIARALGISEHTVKFHINAILGKLGAQSRTEAVVRATRAGLILL